MIRVVLSQSSTADGERCNSGVSHCDYTHGHHPFLLSLDLNVRRDDEFPRMRRTRSREFRVGRVDAARMVRSLNDA